MADYERVICVKNEVFVYRIPPLGSTRGYRAADWKLDQPDWTGRLRVVSKGKQCILKLEDRISGELFAMSTVDAYPGPAVEAVLDSSRYFVIRITDQGRSASIGIGFADRGDSFDLLVALQDHFKVLKREEQEAENALKIDSGPKLDLGFKEGQTIKININTKKNRDRDDDDDGPATTAASRPRPSRGAGGAGGILLPPPPGGVKVSPANSAGRVGAFSQPAQQPALVPGVANNTSSTGSSNLDMLLDFGVSAPAPPVAPAAAAPQSNPADPWGDFTSASTNSNSETSTQESLDADPFGSSQSGWTSFN